MKSAPQPAPPQTERGGLLILLACLTAIFGWMFHQSFLTDRVIFANDAPLGMHHSECLALWPGYSGLWIDTFWLGQHGGSWVLNFSNGLALVIHDARAYLSFYPALSALLVAACAWLFFRTLRFGRLACVLGGVAAALNMNFMSYAGWGLASRGMGLAMIFLALAAVHSAVRGLSWPKIILAGLAIGSAISETADNAAILSLFVSAYAVFLALQRPKLWPLKLGVGVSQVAVMAVCAALMAAQSLEALWGTAVKGIVGMEEQQQMDAATRWNWATQWSVPKSETLRVIIPGLYGYRMDTPEGGNYWGRVGQQPGWETHHQGVARFSGNGEFAGVLVVLVALWGLAAAFVKTRNPFTTEERRAIWFWGALALVSLLVAWGRHGPLYWIIYQLPYFSSIRNPNKWMHPFHLCVMVLFAYGVQGLARQYLSRAVAAGANLFEKRWNYACLGALGVSGLAFLIYSGSQKELARAITLAGFDQALAQEMARFSIREVGLFVVFLAASVGALFFVQSCARAASRARWAGLILGIVLVADLVRSNMPWIKYEVISEKYALNPMLDILREQPHLHRVSAPNFQVPPQLAQWQGLLQQVYQVEWLQYHFPYNNIQSLDVSQLNRVPQDYAAFNRSVAGSPVRLWQLTNTRYILGLAGLAESLNAQLDPDQKRFQPRLFFNIGQRPGGGVTAVETTNGPFALIEFAGALPRVSLYANWEVSTNDSALLKRLADPEFDPARSVLVSEPIAPSPAAVSNAAPATVTWTSYAPKRIRLATQSAVPTVLLLNDRYHGAWKVFVDGQEQPLLRCNYIMRGVQVPAGQHTVEFSFHVRSKTFYITLAACGVGLLLLGVLVLVGRRETAAVAPANETKPPA